MQNPNHDSRLCGKLELMSVYRTNLQIYSNVIVAMRYKPKRTLTREDFGSEVENALRDSVIPRNPLLACKIVDGSTHHPKFVLERTRQLPIRHVKDWSDVQDFLRRDHDDRPSNDELWRVSILPDRNENAFWVSFAFHHAIGDGTAGLLFHEQLLQALQAGPQDQTIGHISLPPAVESCGLDFNVSWKSLAKSVPAMIPMPGFLRKKIFTEHYYAGKSTNHNQRHRNKTGLRTLKLDQEKVQGLRKVAKSNCVSIHALLHAAFAHSIDTEMPLKSCTPISLRPLIPEALRRNIGCYVTVHMSESKLQDDPMSTAKAFYAEINSVAARSDALEILGKLQYLSNSATSPGHPCGMEQFFLNRLNSPYDHCLQATFEISNLGNWKPPELEGWAVDDIHFTGSNSSLGELFNLGVVTIAGGLMNLSCTWRTGYVDDSEVQRLLRKLDAVLTSLLD